MVKFGNFFNSEHKHWELQLEHTSWAPLFQVSVDYSRKCDHAGFTLEFSLLRVFLNFRVYDSRHWNEKNNCWHNHEPTTDYM